MSDLAIKQRAWLLRHDERVFRHPKAEAWEIEIADRCAAEARELERKLEEAAQ